MVKNKYKKEEKKKGQIKSPRIFMHSDEVEIEDIELKEFVDIKLISKLDSLKTSGNLHRKYSEIYYGGVYALRESNRLNNPDWMSQSANSFREILYILQRIEGGEFDKILNNYFSKSLTQEKINEYRSYLTTLYGFLSGLTHHFSDVPDITTQKYLINKDTEIGINPLSKEDYFLAIKLYKEYLKLLIITTLEIHKKIDQCVVNNQKDKDVVEVFFNSSRDSKMYFLSLIDETWLRWFWVNGFFAELKKKKEDLTKYGYRLPELEYLNRMAGKEPSLVADIIISIPISKETFNQEVVGRFFWITEQLPVEEIKRILPKILKENWVKLTAPSGYEYQEMVKKLNEVKDYESLLLLAQIVLTVRDKEDFSDSKQSSMSDRLFYLHDVSRTGIFESILNQDNTKKEESLEIFLNVLTQIINLGEKEENSIFNIIEPFYLLGVDIFNLEIDKSKLNHFREDIQNFITVCKKLIENIFESIRDNKDEAKRLYNNYINILPNSLTCWRLKLYTITRCPNIFKEEIKEALFRVFNVGDKYYDIDGGAEYHQGLIAGFGVLDNTIQREYVTEVINYYGIYLKDKDVEKWRRGAGFKILVFIKEYLTQEEIEIIKSVFEKDPKGEDIVPRPSMGEIMAGSVKDKTPFNPNDLTIDEIVEKLKTDATPKALDEKYRDDDFLNPRNAEGLGNAMQEDFKIRRSEYLTKINLFFDREAIDPAYVYAILRQIEDTLRAKESFSNEECLYVLGFFDLIRQSGENREFEKSEKQAYLADWITVHKVVSDVLISILAVLKDSKTFKDNRSKILSIIKYLLTIKSSPDVDDDKRESDVPANVAVNSVRGQTFRAFVQFVYNDGNKKIEDDVKKLYEHILDTDFSNAVRFTIGQFFTSFYFRDIEFIKGLLLKIFPKEVIGKEKIYFATWEGYLASSLYKELFEELKDYYEYAIKIKTSNYPDRKYAKGLDESLAGHFALAYAHFDLKIGDSLFNLFWETPNETRHYEFVSFVGRSCISRDQAGDKWFEENKVSKEKLIEFWNWIITTDIKIEQKAFSGFGFWINPNHEVIDEKIIIKNLSETFKKSDGDIDWDYGLIQRIKKFAEIDPVSTLDVIKRFFLLRDGLNLHRRLPIFSIDNEIKKALEIIYKNDEMKIKVEELIDLLIEKGSNTFWGLKDILK